MSIPLSVRAGLIAPAALVLLAACQTVSGDGPRAVANLQPTRGNETSGTVTFAQRGGRVEAHAVVTGLKPNREHGFHVHEAGDCSSGDGMSAKGHFNPHGKPHGHHAAMERHAGDMPNLRADANGRADARFELDVVTVATGPAGIVGRGLIVHAQPDDYKSQPVGKAGARMACGIIERG